MLILYININKASLIQLPECDCTAVQAQTCSMAVHAQIHGTGLQSSLPNKCKTFHFMVCLSSICQLKHTLLNDLQSQFSVSNFPVFQKKRETGFFSPENRKKPGNSGKFAFHQYSLKSMYQFII
jgi:hypothetical protein